ncbi:MAG TPA: hypothetical protein VFU05_08630 [Cyclobacteriaceae bacterium]|nr:hypothetical protein [Cyclobacteriaceae bacterium]
MAAQLPDNIILQGEKLDLYSNPLEKFWQNKNKKRPEFHATPICKRGYIATWEIIDKHLILRSVDGNVDKRFFLFWKKTVKFTLKMLFSKARAGVRASWFTGKIRVPLGKRMLYVHNEYDSRFEKEMVITIDKGSVVRTVTLDNVAQKLLIEN